MSGPRLQRAISIPPLHSCSALAVVTVASAKRGVVTLTSERVLMRKHRTTAKHKINGLYLYGALVIAGVFGAMAGSWTVFLIAAGVLVATSVHDGSIRL